MTMPRPKTAVFPGSPGIGDALWHVPFIRAIAETSQDGKVSVIARSSTLAADWLAEDPAVAEVITVFRAKRKHENRVIRGEVEQPARFQLLADLKARDFHRIYHFNHRTKYHVASALARIPHRSGYGYNLRSRPFLNRGPFIPREAPQDRHSILYSQAARFSESHGFTMGRPAPRMFVPDSIVADARARLSAFSERPVVAFSIGASEDEKQWGAENYAALATALAGGGYAAVPLGGPAEAWMESEIMDRVPEDRRDFVMPVISRSVLESAAITRLSRAMVGNDTGMLNVAAANETHSLGLFAAHPPLEHDPEFLKGIAGQSMGTITVPEVLDRLAGLGWLD
jgi:heptosyltransferase-2